MRPATSKKYVYLDRVVKAEHIVNLEQQGDRCILLHQSKQKSLLEVLSIEQNNLKHTAVCDRTLRVIFMYYIHRSEKIQYQSFTPSTSAMNDLLASVKLITVQRVEK
jgi:hypothetical protein